VCSAVVGGNLGFFTLSMKIVSLGRSGSRRKSVKGEVEVGLLARHKVRTSYTTKFPWHLFNNCRYLPLADKAGDGSRY
jgi:hypothetical protein